MIVTDTSNYFHVKNGRCTSCDDPLTIPYVVWVWANTDVFVCAPCCQVMGRDLARDMQGASMGRELQRMGFLEGAKRGAVSGGFLIKEATTTEQ